MRSGSLESRRRGRGRRVAALGAACSVALLASAASAQAVTTSFLSTGAEQVFVVPAGVTSIEVTAVGGKGGNGHADAPVGPAQGALGAKAVGTVPVTPGQVLFVNVGGNGASSTS